MLEVKKISTGSTLNEITSTSTSGFQKSVPSANLLTENAFKRHRHCSRVTQGVEGAGVAAKPFPFFFPPSCAQARGARVRAESNGGSDGWREKETRPLASLQQLLVEEQVCLRVQHPRLGHRLNGGVADVHPLALGAAADVPCT